MSKIAEKKAWGAYPPEYEQEDFDETWDMNIQYREPYIEGYDQAMQDFMEKACKWWSTMPDDTYGFNPCKIYVEQFKNYMQDEIQD